MFLQAPELFLRGKPEWTPSRGHGRVLQTADRGLYPHSTFTFHFFKNDLDERFCLFQDTFDTHILMARSVKHSINFMEAKEEDLHRYGIRQRLFFKSVLTN